MFLTPELLLDLKNNSPKLKILSLIVGSVTPADVENLAAAVANNTVLTHLAINYVNCTASVMVAIADAIGRNKCLVALDLSLNNITDNLLKRLAVGFEKNRRLASLTLRMNQFGDEGAITLFKAIANNDSLMHLNLSYNFMGLKSAIALEECLKTNSRLGCVEFIGNKIPRNYLVDINVRLRINAAKYQTVERDRTFVLAAVVVVQARKLPLELLSRIFQRLAKKLGLTRKVPDIEYMLALLLDNMALMPVAEEQSLPKRQPWRNDFHGKPVFQFRSSSFFKPPHEIVDVPLNELPPEKPGMAVKECVLI